MFSVQIGDEYYPVRDLEGLRCVKCGDIIDLTSTKVEGRLWRYTEHVGNCLGLTEGVFAVWTSGGLEINDQKFSGHTMQPITRPDPVWSRSVEEIFQHFKEGGFDVSLNEEEEVVVVTGLTEDEKYSIDSSGRIHGEGCLRLKILEWLGAL